MIKKVKVLMFKEVKDSTPCAEYVGETDGECVAWTEVRTRADGTTYTFRNAFAIENLASVADKLVGSTFSKTRDGDVFYSSVTFKLEKMEQPKTKSVSKIFEDLLAD